MGHSQVLSMFIHLSIPPKSPTLKAFCPGTAGPHYFDVFFFVFLKIFQFLWSWQAHVQGHFSMTELKKKTKRQNIQASQPATSHLRYNQCGMVGLMKSGPEKHEEKLSTPPCLMLHRVFSWCLRAQRQSPYLDLGNRWDSRSQRWMLCGVVHCFLFCFCVSVCVFFEISMDVVELLFVVLVV